MKVENGLRHLLEVKRFCPAFISLWIACQLQGSPVGSVAHMMPDRQAFINDDHFLIEVFMVSANQNHRALIHELEDISLHRHSLLARVEQIVQDDLLVRLGIGEKPYLF